MYFSKSNTTVSKTSLKLSLLDDSIDKIKLYLKTTCTINICQNVVKFEIYLKWFYIGTFNKKNLFLIKLK